MTSLFEVAHASNITYHIVRSCPRQGNDYRVEFPELLHPIHAPIGTGLILLRLWNRRSPRFWRRWGHCRPLPILRYRVDLLLKVPRSTHRNARLTAIRNPLAATGGGIFKIHLATR